MEIQLQKIEDHLCEHDNTLVDIQSTLRRHDGTLVEIQSNLRRHDETFLEIQSTLRRHHETFVEIKSILRSHDQILKEHGEILKEHSETLKEHGEILIGTSAATMPNFQQGIPSSSRFEEVESYARPMAVGSILGGTREPQQWQSFHYQNCHVIQLQ